MGEMVNECICPFGKILQKQMLYLSSLGQSHSSCFLLALVFVLSLV